MIGGKTVGEKNFLKAIKIIGFSLNKLTDPSRHQ